MRDYGASCTYRSGCVGRAAGFHRWLRRKFKDIGDGWPGTVTGAGDSSTSAVPLANPFSNAQSKSVAVSITKPFSVSLSIADASAGYGADHDGGRVKFEDRVVAGVRARWAPVLHGTRRQVERDDDRLRAAGAARHLRADGRT